VTTAILSSLALEAFAIRRLSLEVTGEADGETHEASIGISYDFFRHATEETKYRVALKVVVKSGTETEPLFHLETEADAFVQVPEEATEDETQVLLMNGVALLYSTLRGSLACVMGLTTIKGFVLPAIDMNKVVRVMADAEPTSESADED